jgi:hypothetical protein
MLSRNSDHIYSKVNMAASCRPRLTAHCCVSEPLIPHSSLIEVIFGYWLLNYIFIALRNELIPWTLFLEKLRQVLKQSNSPHVIESDGALLYLQEPDSSPYPDSDESSPRYTTVSMFIHFIINLPHFLSILILTYHLFLCRRNDFFPSHFLFTVCKDFVSVPCMVHVPLIHPT